MVIVVHITRRNGVVVVAYRKGSQVGPLAEFFEAFQVFGFGRLVGHRFVDLTPGEACQHASNNLGQESPPAAFPGC